MTKERRNRLIALLLAAPVLLLVDWLTVGQWSGTLFFSGMATGYVATAVMMFLAPTK